MHVWRGQGNLSALTAGLIGSRILLCCIGLELGMQANRTGEMEAACHCGTGEFFENFFRASLFS